MSLRRLISWAYPLLLAATALPASAADIAPADVIQVTATREEVPVMRTPASISVVTGEELRTRGASDLRRVLEGLAGVEVSPGGDGGPAASVPALWGLREFDAFLLVVDDVPWGGAFNPALTTLDLHNIDRIEILRGAAPVMYGATSFVGVIHVIHLPAGQAAGRIRLSGGGPTDNPGSLSLSASHSLPEVGKWSQSIAGDVTRERYADEQAGLGRVHALYRAETLGTAGTTRIDVDFNFLRQDPTSPYPRVADGLDPRIDTDANFHPSDARIDEDRFHLSLRHDRSVYPGEWTTTLALSHTGADIVRGYLAEVCGPGMPGIGDNACGHSQERTVSDVYFDTHVVTRLSDRVTAVWGMDNLFGKGEQEARIFGYSVDPVHGNDAPASSAAQVREENELEDERNFFGVYGQLDWRTSDSLDVIFGLRVNSTHETREGEEDLDSGPVPSQQTRSDTKLSGSIGVSWQAWASGENAVTLFADYRDTFKPAAIDFGPEAEADILDPEAAHAAEAGVKSIWFDGTVDVTLAGFDMTMKNLVVPQFVNGSPGLTNGGNLRLKGVEAELRWRPSPSTSLKFAYAHHELRFGEYLRLFDGSPVQLRGKAQELSPDDSGSVGVVYAPPSGLVFTADYSYTGKRFLNKRNTSMASGFSVLDASLGYRFGRWEAQLAGHNLTDSRDPVSESELGDGQYYRMPARNIELSLTAHF